MRTPHLMRRRLRRPATAITFAATMLLLVSCGDRPLSTMDPESPIARDLDNFLTILLVICGVVFVAVQGAVLYMSYKFRVDEPEDGDEVYPDDEFPEQTHGNTRLEWGWTIAPTVLMAIIAVFTVGLLFQLDDVPAQSDARIEKVTVVGQQWWWEFQYELTDAALVDLGLEPGTPGPHIVTSGELPLVLNEEIELDVTSRDVIHSFWVPALNGKRDAVPGRINWWTIEAGAIGRFPGECTEFCGLSHAYMEKWAVGLSRADWDVWAANQIAHAEAPAEGTPEAAGWQVFANQCASCHVVNGLTTVLDEAGDGNGTDEFADYHPHSDGLPIQYLDDTVQVAGVAPNLTHLMSRSTFGGGIFELYQEPDSVDYVDLSAEARLNRGDLEAWIRNAPEVKANAWDALSPDGEPRPRGMRPFEGAISTEDMNNLIAFLRTLD